MEGRRIGRVTDPPSPRLLRDKEGGSADWARSYSTRRMKDVGIILAKSGGPCGGCECSGSSHPW